MQIVHTLLSAVVASCAVAPAANMNPAVPGQDLLGFPAPKTSLPIAAPSQDKTLFVSDLLRDLGRVTGHVISASQEVQNELNRTPVGLFQAVDVPPGEIYSFVESLLLERGFFMAVLHGDEPRMLGIYSPKNAPMPPAQTVSSDQLEACRDHPALFVRTVLDLEWLDVRALGNSMRAVSGGDRPSAMIPLGNSNSILIEGAGGWVASMAKLLSQSNESARESMERMKKLQEERAKDQPAKPPLPPKQ